MNTPRPGPKYIKGYGGQSLPPGLTPGGAGRWGLWFLGKRQQARAAKRAVLTPTYDYAERLSGRAANLIRRWNADLCPGKRRALGQIIGVTPETARVILSGRRNLTPDHARRLLAWLEAEMVQRLEVMRELRVEVHKPPPPRRKGNVEALRKYEKDRRLAKIKSRQQAASGNG
jgi:hypothetical protein